MPQLKTKVSVIGFMLIALLHISFNENVVKTSFIKKDCSDTLPPNKVRVKQNGNSIFSGLKKGYSVYLTFNSTYSEALMRIQLEASLKSQGYKVLSNEEYIEVHKRANEEIFRQAIASGTVNQEEIANKLRNYPYRICIISFAIDLNSKNDRTISGISWRIYTDPPSSGAEKKTVPSEFFHNKHIDTIAKALSDSLVFYSK